MSAGPVRPGWSSALGAILLGLFVLQLWVHVTRTTATWDEPVHILSGYRSWQCGDFVTNPQHPPLLKLLATAPLLTARLVEPDWTCGSRTASWREIEYAGAQLLARNGVERMLVATRTAAALMSVVLAILVVLLARAMFGPAEALVALALLVFEPTVIAHGSLVTTDMAMSVTTLAAVYALYGYGRRPSTARLLASGVAVGLMLAAKHSGVLMLPVLLLLMLVDAVLHRPHNGRLGLPRVIPDLLHTGLAFGVILIVALGVVWSAYGFNYYALPGTTHESLSIPDLFRTNAPDAAPSVAERLIEIIHRARLLPEAHTYGLAYVAAASARPTYLFGTVYPTGRWFYFPAAFAIKSSLALLILFPLSLAVRPLYRTHGRAMLFLLLPSLAYFAISMTSSLNIGVRHLLPVYPFFIVVAAAGACACSRRRRWCLYGLVVLLGGHAFTAARTAPNYIAFANDLWGGTRNTYRLLNDSNADWGQTLKVVQTYVEQHGIRECWFAAFGMADVVRPYTSCRPLPAHGWAVTGRLVDPVPPVIDGTIFLSAYEFPPWGGPEYAPLAAVPPADVIGGGVLVFRGRFDVPLAAALSYAARADQLLGWQRYAESLQDARRAVELAPNDPRTHWELAAAYERNGMPDEARREADISRALRSR
jgi:4-amino-4-deoxy-L-arabinose transferase-like glycosyltransferase